MPALLLIIVEQQYAVIQLHREAGMSDMVTFRIVLPPYFASADSSALFRCLYGITGPACCPEKKTARRLTNARAILFPDSSE